MGAPTRLLLTDLSKGHTFPDTHLVLSAERVAGYLSAVGDGNAIYLERGFAPPLAAAALALGALLDVIELPAGALHTGQEVEAHAGVPIDVTLTLSGRIAQRSERAGLVISVIEFELRPEGSAEAALKGGTTVMVQAGAS